MSGSAEERSFRCGSVEMLIGSVIRMQPRNDAVTITLFNRHGAPRLPRKRIPEVEAGAEFQPGA